MVTQAGAAVSDDGLTPAFPRIVACGETAVSVEFAETIDLQANRAAIALGERLTAEPPLGLVEVVPAYRSLLVIFDPVSTDASTVERAILEHLPALVLSEGRGRLVRVPVLYEGEACLDLVELAAAKGMSPEALVALHGFGEYTVAMIGFAPGFAYLSGLPEPLHTPRRAVPRQRVPEGAFGIGGMQASVNSLAGPSGWHFIGQTPLKLFDPARDEPFLLAAGDRVRFEPIGREAFDAIRSRVGASLP